MFDEKEPGKPQNWGWTIGIIVVICILNLTIFVVIRVMLDSENEFDEPLVQGELRQTLTQFLGIFALSFSFGCWCCFCCMGNCFKWATCCFHEQTRENVTNCWSSYMKHQHNIVEQVNKKSSSIFVAHRRDRVSVQEHEDLEIVRPKNSTVVEKNSPKAYVRFDINEQESDESNQGENKELNRPRPTNLGHHDLQARRKSGQWMEIQKPVIDKSAFEARHHMRNHQEFRRHSVAVGARSHGRNSIGVHNVHYYEIPVSLITPNAVAILDPSFAGNTDSEDSDSVATTTVQSPTLSALSPATLSPIKQEEVSIGSVEKQ